MQRVIETIKNFLFYVNKHRAVTLFIAAIILLVFFVLSGKPLNNIKKESAEIRNNVIERQKILEHYVDIVINYHDGNWVDLDGFPNDMVIYKYNSDTIQFWKNEFPISNEDIIPQWYRLFNTKNLFSTPLAYINDKSTQFVNLGTGWYLVNIYREGWKTKIISGLLIKTEYLSSNAALVSKVNPKISKNNNILINPIDKDEGMIIRGVNNEPLFRVAEGKLSNEVAYNFILGWIIILLLTISLYSALYNHRTFTYYFLFILGLILLRVICLSFDSYLMEHDIFSPVLYADSGLFSSFGNLLLNNMFVFLAVSGLYLLRRRIINFFIKSNNSTGDVKSFKRLSINILLKSIIYLLPIFIILYINFTLKSLISNSTIVLEIYRLDELSVYSFLAYLSYGLLFICLLLSLQMLISAIKGLRGKSLLKIRFLIFYIFSISLYTIILVSICGLHKEKARSHAWTNKLSVERDIGVELQLKSVGAKIQSDPVISGILGNSNSSDISNLDVILGNRLDELYLKGLSQRYEIKINICRPNDVLMYNQGQYMVDCNKFFNSKLQNAVQLGDNSYFYYLDKGNGSVYYFGIFYYLTSTGIVNLFIELESRYNKDMLGYPAELFNYKPVETLNMPYSYSYGKYVDNKLVAFRGSYNFPVSIVDTVYNDNFSTFSKGNNIFFVNKSATNKLVIITRQKQNILLYLVSFSYLLFFYGGLIFIFLRLRRLNKRLLRKSPVKNSFRRRITYLITSSLVVALICMGAGSIWFSVNFYKGSSKLQMDEKIQSVQSTLSEYCRYVNAYTQLNTQDFVSSLNRIASSIQVDINLYDPYGRLIRSTKPELFDKFLISSRMDSDAYYKLIYEKKRQVYNNEKIASFSYVSLYAPIFNSNGTLIAIANIPYFAKGSDFRGDLSSIIATIINIYLILLIVTILGGSVLSNQLAKPLYAIRSKMKEMDVSKKIEHIDYKGKDELGLLVGAYNKMVDDLEESTMQLAKNEREHAWSEMARQIAHEIKNPLTPMRLSIQHLVRMKQNNIAGWENKFEDVANSILEQIEILSNTASEFSSFAKFYFEEASEFNLYPLLEEQKLLFDTHDNIRILLSNSTENAIVYARRGQIIRVVVNLLSNAVQAVEANNGGYIRIHLTEKNGEYSVSFEDNGPGVKLEDVPKLFKPNFTTKSSGTGLGLAISKNIIEQSGGTIFYSKSEFGGANFTFTLPLHFGSF